MTAETLLSVLLIIAPDVTYTRYHLDYWVDLNTYGHSSDGVPYQQWIFRRKDQDFLTDWSPFHVLSLWHDDQRCVILMDEHKRLFVFAPGILYTDTPRFDPERWEAAQYGYDRRRNIR